MALYASSVLCLVILFAYIEATIISKRESENEDFESLYLKLHKMEEKLIKARAEQQKSLETLLKQLPEQPCNCKRGFPGIPGRQGFDGYAGLPGLQGLAGDKGDSFKAVPA